MLFFPMSPTETELINDRIAQQSNVTTEKIIQELIENHDTREMREGVRYYENKNDILQRRRYYYQDGQKVEDQDGLKPNNRIPHNWHRLLVDQKTSYLVGKPVTFTADQADFHEKLNEILCEEFDDTLTELVKNAANKGIEWLHPYIDEEGRFDYVRIPAEQAIPIWEGSLQKRLQNFLRYYTVIVNGEERIKAEWYDENTVTYFIESENGGFVMDVTEAKNPASHFYYGDNGYGWGRVPFIPFRNNEEEKSDLTFYKELIDEYDRTVSDNANEFEELQELIYVLKGYEGESLSEFMQNLLFYKAINVAADDGSGVETLNNEIPMESAEKHLDRLEESIYTFGQGVNTRTDKFGASPSGVALQFLYSLLDLKVDHTERKFRKGLQEFLWFITEYLSISGQGDYSGRDVQITFNRSMITNETEIVDQAEKSKGIISDETIIANHPWVDDVKEEQKRIARERMAYGADELEAVEDELEDGEIDEQEPGTDRRVS